MSGFVVVTKDQFLKFVATKLLEQVAARRDELMESTEENVTLNLVFDRESLVRLIEQQEKESVS